MEKEKTTGWNAFFIEVLQKQRALCEQSQQDKRALGVAKAIRAIANHHGPLNSAAECALLPGIGPKTADMLHVELQKHILFPSIQPSQPATQETSVNTTNPSFKSPQELVEAFLAPLGQNYIDLYRDPFVGSGFDSRIVLENLTDEDITNMADLFAITVPIGHRKSILLQAKSFAKAPISQAPTAVSSPASQLIGSSAMALPRLQRSASNSPPSPAAATSANAVNQSKIFSIQREGFVVPFINDKVIVENVNTQFVGRAQWINDNGDVRFIRHEPSYDETSPESHLLISEVNGDQVFPFKVSLHVKTNLGALPKITLAHCGCGGRGAGYCEHIGATLYALRDYRLTGAEFIHYGEQPIPEVSGRKENSQSIAHSLQQHQEDMKKILAQKNRSQVKRKSSSNDSQSDQSSQPRDDLPTPSKKHKPKETTDVDSQGTETGKREYVPKYGSGGWAIMIALHEYHTSLRPGELPFGLLKIDVSKRAQPYTSASFIDNDPGKYNAWSNMATLRSKGLVSEEKKATGWRYKLTDAGMDLAKRLYDAKMAADAGRKISAHSVDKLEGGELEIANKNSPLQLHSVVQVTPPQPKANVFEVEDDDVGPLIAHKSDETNEIRIGDPLDYDVQLYADNREFRDERARRFLSILKAHDLPIEWRNLILGDFVWIARKKSEFNNNQPPEIVLNCIVERKTIDDLWSSIDDNRFSEQNHRLQKSGLEVIYLIEGIVEPAQRARFTTVVTSIQFEYGFTVRRTETTVDSVFLLQSITRQLQNTLLNSTTHSMFSKYTFERFQGMFTSHRSTGRELFAEQLMQIPGVTPPKASSIVEKYPTLRSLLNAFRANDQPEKLLCNLTFGDSQAKIGAKVSTSVHRFYMSLQGDDSLG